MVHKFNKTKKESATMDSNVKYLNPKADLTFKIVKSLHLTDDEAATLSCP